MLRAFQSNSVLVGCCAATVAATALGVPKHSFVSSCDPQTSACTALQKLESQQHKSFSPKEFRSFTIESIRDVSPNTKVFHIALPSCHHEMGMQTAGFLMVKGPVGEDGKDTMRPYTPITTNDQRGSFDLLVKAYPTGVVSSYLHSLKTGDQIDVKGPILKFWYVPNMKKRIGMIAGGSGITPMLQIIHEIANNPHDHTEVDLIFANNTEADILLKEELDSLARRQSNIRVHYVVATPTQPQEWKGYVGFVTEAIVRHHVPEPNADNLVLVCGPPAFMNVVSGNKTPDYKQGEVSGLLKTIGYTSDMVFKF